ncbi:hypothetical protein [Natrialba sp. INN-245]|uniref:hypothetical protein n=1 Tax=Natrialba sp. INN-245 TaxID=2690967 RepID=UPI001313381C|nr:hypothetical protein [Natrialba sp. INN-245]MWV38324.1 hypothetical protein [Natrialba sp. INN-245]
MTIAGNRIHCRSGTDYGVHERDGSGPTTVVDNTVVRAAREANQTSNPETREIDTTVRGD